MSRVLVIGCGGVASVAIQKCCQADTVFTELCIASRTKEKCDALARKLEGKTKTVITTAKVDADDVNQLIQLINSYKPDLVITVFVFPSSFRASASHFSFVMLAIHSSVNTVSA